ncbi:MAG: 6,7-dimethyl-8-ribityllumazine synthase [Candidatus Dadabacteria bacterium]|nr:6,7-dimethyl-8-ribityllumazine synthase [Candidatus Dadabacteria bacterium]MXZ12971.1 6,7-dimethyl-8-ribityllumazine synthase [Candidatus Dadabacteria bacterium]MYA49063.1 6,7-dimethyl-8-ribityllumazine synthase [Candidatus Dadabacteria bacterium]MYC39800.1 6,7-dimethyl-8-ribityllumazine synthase [Candidatus Dadabacteria bacterium]MYF47749.1 6,7-dimethyl-8-ribityllumazine synthase [Candidatus Dadabacteria bacterium]
MPETIEGKLSAGKFRFAIVSSRVNSFVTNPMTEGAIDTLVRHGASDRSIDVIKVPGSFEVPLAVKKAALSGKYDAVVAIGAIIRGQTSHFDFLASQVTKDLSAVALETGVPVCSGIITTETTEQAIERAGVKAGNRGSEAALSALEMVNLVKALS